MIHCPKCVRDVNPTIDLGGGCTPDGVAMAVRPVYLCPSCESFLSEVDGQSKDAAPAPERKPAPVIPIHAPKVVAVETKSDPIDILAHCRSRLSAIETALAQHDELKSEARRLKSMIRAGEKSCKRNS